MKHFSTRNFFKFFFLISLLGISTVTYTNQTGAPSGNTGAPSETNCTSCHSGTPITSGTAHGDITLTGLPAGGYALGTTYTLTVSGGAAATSKNGFQMTVLTAGSAMAGSFTAGTGSQTQISGGRTYIGHTNTGTSGTWTFSWTSPSSASGALTFYLAFNATNSSNTNVGDAIYLKTFSVSPGNLPVATINSPANSSIFCLGDSIQFTGSATNSPTSYNWQFLGNSPNASTQQNPKMLFAQAGFTTVRFSATNSSGTSPVVSISIQIVAKPSATITPSPGTVICGTDSVTLLANTGTGLSYLWSPGNQTGPVLKVGSPGSYSVKVTNSSGCFRNSSPVAVTQSTKPTMNITLSRDTICSTDSLLVTASNGFAIYGYYLDSVLIASVSQNAKNFFLPPGKHEIAVVGFNGTCYSTRGTAEVVVQTRIPAPTLSCGTASSNSVTLNIGGTIPAQISTDGGSNWITPNGGFSHTVNGLTPNQSVNFLARTNAPAPCLYSLVGSKTCVANPCQPMSYTLSYSKTTCLKNTADSALETLTISNLSKPSLMFSFNNSNFGTSLSRTYMVKAGLHQVHLKSVDSLNTSCGILDSVLLFYGVDPIAQVPVLSMDRPKACENGSIAILLTNKPGNVNTFKYFLNTDSLPFSVRTKASADLPLGSVAGYKFKNGDQVRVEVMDSVLGCKERSAPLTLQVVAPYKAGFTYTKNNLILQVSDTVLMTTNRNWSFGDSTLLVNSGRTQSHTYSSAGTYQVILTTRDTNGCYSADTQVVNMVLSGLVQNTGTQPGVTLFPNPAGSQIAFHWDGISNETIQVGIFDVVGRQWISETVEKDSLTDISGLAKGEYVVRIQLGDQVSWKKLIVQ